MSDEKTKTIPFETKWKVYKKISGPEKEKLRGLIKDAVIYGQGNQKADPEEYADGIELDLLFEVLI